MWIWGHWKFFTLRTLFQIILEGQHAIVTCVRIENTLDELINGLATVASISIIGVCWWKGKCFTHDNRRLWIYRKAEELRIINLIPVYGTFPMKFTTYNEGQRVSVRGDAGGISWRRLTQERYKN